MTIAGRTVVLSAVLVLFPLPAPAGAQPRSGSSPGTQVARLDALLASGDTAGANSALSALAPALGRDERLAFDVIHVLIRRGRFAEARAQWNRLAARLQASLPTPPRDGNGSAGRSVSNPEQRRRLGEALFTQALLVAHDGEKADALKLLGQADGLGFPPLDSPLMMLAAECLRGLQEFGMAANAYREYLARAPADLDARLGLATVLYAARSFDAARGELEEVLRRAPRTPRASYLLGAVLVELNRYEEARRFLERELARDPGCQGCLSRLAHVAYLEGRDRECAALLAKAMALDASDVETQMIAGLLAFRQDRYEEAVDRLSRVVERSPSYMAARYQLAMAYRRLGNAAKAREHFDAYRRLLDEQKARENSFRGEQ